METKGGKNDEKYARFVEIVDRFVEDNSKIEGQPGTNSAICI